MLNSIFPSITKSYNEQYRPAYIAASISYQVRWYNPTERSDYNDNSGFGVYYTHQLRPNDGRVARVGQTYLDIPPGLDEVNYRASCSGFCTQTMSSPVFITQALIQMNALGKLNTNRLLNWRPDERIKIRTDIRNNGKNYRSWQSSMFIFPHVTLRMA